MKTLLFLTLFITNSLLADDGPKAIADFDVKTDIIADNYEAGAYLMYDCVEKHWVCVLESYYKECDEKRTADLLKVDDPYHTCAPIEKMPNKKSCFQRQLFLTTHNFGARFCIKESWKDKNIDF